LNINSLRSPEDKKIVNTAVTISLDYVKLTTYCFKGKDSITGKTWKERELEVEQPEFKNILNLSTTMIIWKKWFDYSFGILFAIMIVLYAIALVIGIWIMKIIPE